MPVKKQIVRKSNKPVVQPKVVKSVARPDKKSKCVSFGRAVSNFFKKYFQFNGVATRAEYWWAMLFVVIGVVGLISAAWFLQPVNLLVSGFVAMMWVLFCVVIIVPTWAVMARRLHDAGFTARLLYINLVFLVYSILVPWVIAAPLRVSSIIGWLDFCWGIVMLVLACFPSKTQNNPYRD